MVKSFSSIGYVAVMLVAEKSDGGCDSGDGLHQAVRKLAALEEELGKIRRFLAAKLERCRNG